MVVNGHSKLVCRLQIAEVMQNFDEIVIEPMRNFEVVKDLVVDMDRFWDKMESVTPCRSHRWRQAGRRRKPPPPLLLVKPGYTSDQILDGLLSHQCPLLAIRRHWAGHAARSASRS